MYDHFPPAKKQPPPSPSPAPPPAGYERCLICPTCDSVCRLLTSTTPLNPGRQFYKCPDAEHKSFKWADDVNPSCLIDVPPCGGCKAGTCRVRKEKTGSNAGRILFMCRVKEGEGSCGFRVWQDELEVSAERADERRNSSPPTTNCNGHGHDLENANLVDGSTQSDAAANIGSPVIDKSTDLQCHGAASRKMEKLKCQENEPYESSKRPPKRSRHGDVKAPDSLVSGSPLTCRLASNTAPIQQWWMETAIYQNLRDQLQGWWGRLVFHPMHPLIVHGSQPPTFNVSWNIIDSYLMSRKTVLGNSDASTTLTQSLLEVGCCSAPLPGRLRDVDLDALDAPSCSSDPCSTRRFGNVMLISISKAFSEAAMDLQNQFLDLLESMDVQDLEAISGEAETTFSALDCLMFDHQGLKKLTKELIHHAKTLYEIEQSMPRSETYQELIDNCSTERTRLDEINRVHAETAHAMTSNKKHLKVLQEQFSSAKDWLLKIETELSFFEDEMRNMQHEMGRISDIKSILEGEYVTASKELEEFGKLHEQKESECSAAKAAYARTRAMLGQYRCIE